MTERRRRIPSEYQKLYVPLLVAAIFGLFSYGWLRVEGNTERVNAHDVCLAGIQTSLESIGRQIQNMAKQPAIENHEARLRRLSEQLAAFQTTLEACNVKLDHLTKDLQRIESYLQERRET